MKIKKTLCLLTLFFLVGCAVREEVKSKEPLLEEYLIEDLEPEAEELKSAPDFELQDLNQKTYMLSDYRDKQAVALFFWTTWCPHCRRELAVLNQRYAEVSVAGLELLSINVGEADYKVANAVEKYNLTV
ncbi:MAG: redoxin domain-containing protein, partial [Candidatus Omnitrophica bacterium]|nr:redoxin domain-containing protein [Candidatus Omnitrophota bacterium]